MSSRYFTLSQLTAHQVAIKRTSTDPMLLQKRSIPFLAIQPKNIIWPSFGHSPIALESFDSIHYHMRVKNDRRENRMTALQHNNKAFIRKGENQYVAECLEISVVTQGRTLDETIANLREAVAIHLENEDLAEFGLTPNPTLLLTMESNKR